MDLMTVLRLLGTFAIIVPYLLAIFGRWKPNSYKFLLTNLIGSGLLIYLFSISGTEWIPFILLNTITVIGTIYQIIKLRKQGKLIRPLKQQTSEAKVIENLSYYIKRCGESANVKGWKINWHTYPQYLLATIDELMDSFERGWRNDNKKKAFIEIGDCFVRLFHICHDLEIPLEEILRKIMKDNERRKYKHGHARI